MLTFLKESGSLGSDAWNLALLPLSFIFFTLSICHPLAQDHHFSLLVFISKNDLFCSEFLVFVLAASSSFSYLHRVDQSERPREYPIPRRCQKQREQATARVPLLPNNRQHNQLWQGSDGVL